MTKFWTNRAIKILGAVVKRAGEERGWTVRDTEKLTGELYEGRYTISRGTMSDFERGIRIPAHNTVIVLDWQEAELWEMRSSQFPFTVDTEKKGETFLPRIHHEF